MQNPWLIHGDCLEHMAKIPASSVDLILADLPYGTTRCKWDTTIPFDPLWEKYWSILKPDGAVVLFGAEPFSSYLRISQIQYFKYDWIWEKTRGQGFVNAKHMPLKSHEIISVFSRKSVANGSFNMVYYPQGLATKNKNQKTKIKKAISYG